MADEREGAPPPRPGAADADKIQARGREANAAQPLNAAPDAGGPERRPADEGRSFDPAAAAPTPRQGAGDGSPAATQPGHMGPQGDPAEGKRDAS